MYHPALRMPSLPTEDDLPCDDGEPMETLRHRLQMELLIHSLGPWAQRRGDCFVGGNMFLWLRVAEYFWFDPWNPADFAGFRLDDGRYLPILPREPGRIPSPLPDLDLCWWDGTYGGVEARWIRWANPDGELLPTEAARAAADTAQAAAHAAKADADAARTQAERALEACDLESRRAAEAEARAQAAEAELARLRAQLSGTP